MKKLYHKHTQKIKQAVKEYHTSDTRLHHHTLVLGLGISIVAAMMARNFGGMMQGDTQTHASQEVDMSMIVIASPDEVQNGNEFAINLHYSTIGGSLDGVDVSLDLPDELVLSSSTLDGYTTTDGDGMTTYTWSNIDDTDVIIVEALANGSSGRNGLVAAQITTSQAGVTDTNPSNDDDEASITILGPPILSADLSISQVADVQQLMVGEDISYTVTYTNAGPDQSQSTYVFAVLPDGLTYIASGTSPSPDLLSGNSLRRDIGTLAVDASDTITLKANASVLLDSGSTVENSVSIESLTTDIQTHVLATTVIPGKADLTLSKIASQDSVAVGEAITYSYAFENEGIGPATNVTITDTFPVGYTYVSSSLPPTVEQGAYSWDLYDLDVDDVGFIDLVIKPNAIGTLDETATIASDTPDSDMTNNTSSYAVQVVAASQEDDGDDENNNNDNHNSPVGGGGSSNTSSSSAVSLNDDTAQTEEQEETDSENTDPEEEETTDEATQEDEIQEKEQPQEIPVTLNLEQKKALTYAQELGYERSAQVEQSITRADLAELLVLFLSQEMDKKPDLSKECVFADSNRMSTQVRAYTTIACQYGLMGVGVDAFDPAAPVDRATFATVISRALFGSMFDTHTSDRYTQHARALKHIGVMNNIDSLFDTMLQTDAMIVVERLYSSGLSQKIREKLPTITK